MKEEPIHAWQPLTFGGVARYAHDWIGKLFLTCLIVSLLVAGAVVWTATRVWVPTIDSAIQNLPAGVELSGGRLRFVQAARLAESRFLAIHLGPAAGYGPASSADVNIVLDQEVVRFRSIFGAAAARYPVHWTFHLSPAETDPWWGAWKPAVLAYAAGGVILSMFASLMGLGLVYTPVPRLIALFTGRRVTLWGSFKLAIAALLPGAVLMAIAISLYGMNQIRLLELIAAWFLHFLIGWIFLVGASLKLPRLFAGNPFDAVSVDPAVLTKAPNGTGADPPPHE